MQHDVYRPTGVDRLSAGVDNKGMPIAWNNRLPAPRSSPDGFRQGSTTAWTRTAQTERSIWSMTFPICTSNM